MENIMDVKERFWVTPGGHIASPGKFEGEMWYAPIVYEWFLDGEGTEVTWQGWSGAWQFPLTDEDRERFDVKWRSLVLELNNDGFVHVAGSDRL